MVGVANKYIYLLRIALQNWWRTSKTKPLYLTVKLYPQNLTVEVYPRNLKYILETYTCERLQLKIHCIQAYLWFSGLQQ